MRATNDAIAMFGTRKTQLRLARAGQMEGLIILERPDLGSKTWSATELSLVILSVYALVLTSNSTGDFARRSRKK